MKFETVALIIISIAGAVFALLFFLTRDRQRNGIKRKSTTLRQELNDIGVLETAEYCFTHVESFSKERTLGKLALPLTQSNTIFSYEGRVVAGIDFAQITVDEKEESIKVTLPNACIIDTVIDVDSFQLYDERKKLFSKVSIEDLNTSLVNIKDNETNKAIEKGLLEKADANAIKLVRGLVSKKSEKQCSVSTKKTIHFDNMI